MLKFGVDSTEPGKQDIVGLGLSHENLRRIRKDSIQFHASEVGLGSGIFVIAHVSDPQLPEYKRLLGTSVRDLIVLNEYACHQLETTAAIVNLPLKSKRRPDRPCQAVVFAGPTEEAIVEAMKTAGLITSATTISGPAASPKPARSAKAFAVSILNRLKLGGGGIGFVAITAMLAAKPGMEAWAILMMAVTAAVLLGMAAMRWSERVEIDEESIRCNRVVNGFEMRWRDVARVEAREDSLGPYELHLVGRAGQRHKLHRIYESWDDLVDAITSRV